MTTGGQQIDQIMEQASDALAGMAYLRCEKLCLEALRLARQAKDFDTLGRIVLPLQEARRQRRQTAVEAGLHVMGPPSMDPQEICRIHPVGCLLLLDPPYTDADQQAIRQLAFDRQLYLEVLRFDESRLGQCFEEQMERVGDAALTAIASEPSPVAQVDALIECVNRIGDHEAAHQRLADAARRAARPD